VAAVDGQALPEGAMLVAREGDVPLGHVTTAAPRVAPDPEGLTGGIGLALLTDGASRQGEELLAWSATRGQTVRVRVRAGVL
jgi:sarcosine oxidase subunit alpha